MEPEEETKCQTDIKLQVNNLLWSVLPANATIKEAEDVSVAIWEKIVELRSKYKCTGPGS